jgi:uncharacterized protein YbcI
MLQDDASTEIPDTPAGIAPPAPALEIANAIARLHKEFVGRGPTNSRTTIDGELVVVLLEGGFTRAERTLDDSERRDLVLAGRVGLQDAMRTAMIEVVQQVMGRAVRSFMSANDLERNLQSEIFVLEGPSTPDVVDDPPVSR